MKEGYFKRIYSVFMFQQIKSNQKTRVTEQGDTKN